jgi:protein phosphatase
MLRGKQEAAEIRAVRSKPWNDRPENRGLFDIIGDIHGCYDELCELLQKLDYAVDAENHAATPPRGRTAVFLGDLCDRGPKNVDVLRLVIGMVKQGQALAVPGNHDAKLLKKLNGRSVQLNNGLDATVAELDRQPSQFAEEVRAFLDALVSHYVLDQGKLVVAHAGLKEHMQGHDSSRVRDFCLYGDTTGEVDEYGLPVRLDWASEYHGRALVVYGHTPRPEVREENHTLCIDTGCVFGGKLTAYRYPEGEIVQVKAIRQYYVPAKPLLVN